MEEITVKWNGNDFKIEQFSKLETVLDLKEKLKSLTGVLPERQKLLGLKLKGISFIAH